MDRELKRSFIASCKPDEPVGPQDPRHYDFDTPSLRLRGEPWRERLSAVIDFAAEPTAQLVTGLRGSGKTTELRQLERDLTERGYRVVMADAGQWLSNERPLTTEDLMLALVLALFPDGKPEDVGGWVDEYAKQAWRFLNSKVELQGGIAAVKASLTTDETLFQRVAKQLRDLDGLREDIHELLASAAKGSRDQGQELVIILDGAEKRATGDLDASARREEFHNHWFASFILQARDLKPPVHTIYTVPPFMVRRASELTANFGVELQFLPMVRLYERDGVLNLPGVEAMVEALHRRVAAKHFADPAIPRWLVSRCGGYFRDLLRFLTEMTYRVGEAPRFTREHAEQAVAHVQQNYLQALVLEDKQLLRQLHPSRKFPDDEASQVRMDSLLQGFKMFRYHNGGPWYDAHPLSWAELGFADDLPDWSRFEGTG
ncbi:Type II secretory pathway, ATPase PulE/Tfp pilus assembly pathway, ATPase PilB [Enhygromyxa salina]|uniref:Type II secretory pathway, ATPase PulE/Tfp pilus assembly pathway, ATPase PilB n=1 Tax=Enhygromyxa salina TaxID=215803 RepID=A0A0C2CRF9_9BACT|nr:ATP-binding protein [Enhygromyxa salina]KIG13751.1 Type II secretory pathway, ATPase PulE/Tfp pilus assembly pathway, ATPase PilB [Enhygromyxa salina]